MSFAQLLLPEFEQEMAGTRKVLERIPDDKADWKAHAKSNTIGWVEGTLTQDSWDIQPPGGEPYRTPPWTNRAEMLAQFDKNVADAKRAIAATADEAFLK